MVEGKIDSRKTALEDRKAQEIDKLDELVDGGVVAT
jgi:hypothetical protein